MLVDEYTRLQSSDASIAPLWVRNGHATGRTFIEWYNHGGSLKLSLGQTNGGTSSNMVVGGADDLIFTTNSGASTPLNLRGLAR
jgi:hypothetical protein